MRNNMIIKILKYFLITFFVLQHVRAQTYTVGDTVDNFGAEICENDSGYWDYNTDGLHRVVWMNLFTSW